jgi:signal peptidase I
MRVDSAKELQGIFSDPNSWSDHEIFRDRRSVNFPLEEDQFFPLGDNSPQSKDARLWSDFGTPPHYVKRELLLGKALIIYWPHLWRPFLPNFTRMGLIR